MRFVIIYTPKPKAVIPSLFSFFLYLSSLRGVPNCDCYLTDLESKRRFIRNVRKLHSAMHACFGFRFWQMGEVITFVISCPNNDVKTNHRHSAIAWSKIMPNRPILLSIAKSYDRIEIMETHCWEDWRPKWIKPQVLRLKSFLQIRWERFW